MNSRCLAFLLALAALAADWPQWRGPNRDNVSPEKGLLQAWPKDGPDLLWKATGLGEGVASPSIANGRVFVLGYRMNDEYLAARSTRDGKELWATRVGPGVKEMSAMRWLSQRTPTVDGERVYAFTAGGLLVCLESATGKELWRKDYAMDFGGKRGPWGYCDYPLVDGGNLICTPGVGDQAVVALDKKTGELIWKCAVPKSTRGTHSAPVISEAAGVRQIVHFLDCGPVGISARDGKLLWELPLARIGGGNVHTPLVRDDLVYFTCGWGVKGAILRLSPGKEKGAVEVKEVAEIGHNFDSWIGSSVLLGDFLHSADGACIDTRTGKVVGKHKKVSPRSTLVAAEGRLYHRRSDGTLTLSEWTEKDGYVVHGEFKPPRTRDVPWCFPAIAGGCLFLRDHDMLLCYDLKADKKPKEKGLGKKAPREPDAIFVPSPMDVVEKMLALGAVKKDDVVVDLGCGDGRFLIAAARKYGCRGVGYELDADCVALARQAVKEAGVEKLVRIVHGDLFDADLSGSSVVMLFLLPEVNRKLLPQLSKMKDGSRIVSHAFEIPGLLPDRVVPFTPEEEGTERKLFVYTTPLKPAKKEAGP
jgi:outer membrane protein assembly factor BamB/SAM-dependent methyltransferase